MKRGFKWVAYAVAFVLFLLLSENATPLSDRAIVVGLAVDREESDYIVSVQILVASSGEKDSNGSAVVSARNDTLSGALSDISKQTGLAVALSHCNLVIFGQGVLEGYAYTTLDYLRRNAYLSENALLVAADNALEILKTDVAFGKMASFYAQRALIAYGEYKGIARKTVKDFLISYYSHGGGNWLTVMRPMSIADMDDPSAEEEKAQYVFDLSETAILKKGNYVFTATENETAGLNYFHDPLERGAVTVDGDGGEKIELYILKGEGEAKFDPDKLEVSVNVELNLLLKEIVRQSDGDGGNNVETTRNSLTKTEEERLKNGVAGDIRAIFEHAAAEGVDVFDCYGGFYRKGGAKWEKNAPEEYLSKTSLKISVKVKYE